MTQEQSLYSLGYNDGWNRNVPNPEYENNDQYMTGYDSGYDDRHEQYQY